MSLLGKIRRAIQSTLGSGQSGFAPIDPFGRDIDDDTQLSQRFKILRANFVLGLETIPRYQELQRDKVDCWFLPEEAPALILFVSHRWETPYQPDPHAHQLGALKSFLRALQEIAIATECEGAERLKRVPSLSKHGVLQAAWLLGATGWQDFLKEVWNSDNPKTLGERILSGIGIWYDYACMPQRSPVSDAQRNDKDEAEFIEGLRALHGLIAKSTLLILRREGDDYEHRGWCAAELSVGTSAWRHLVLRMDLIGQNIDVKDIRGIHDLEIDDSFDVEERERVIQNIARWEDPEETNVRGALRRIYLHYLGFQALEEQRKTPIFTTPRPPDLFPGHKRLLTEMLKQQGSASQAETLISDGRLLVDVASWVNTAMDAAELRCSDDRDRLYVGLLILYVRHIGLPQMAEFYADCLRRLLDGKHLRLVHYRQLRELMTARVWWVFEGEPFKSDRRNLPKWAR